MLIHTCCKLSVCPCVDSKCCLNLSGLCCAPHRLNQKRMYLQQSQGMGLQAYFNQMQIAEGSYPTGGPALDPAASQSSPPGPSMSAAQQQGSPQASPPFSHPHSLSPLMEPGEGLVYDPYMSHHHYTQHLPPGPHLHHQLHHPLPHEASGLGFTYPAGCEQQVLGPSTEGLHPEQQYDFPLDPALLPPPAPGEAEAGAMAGILAGPGQSDGLGLPELQGSLLDSEMMETVDSQHGFVLVN